MSAVAGAALVDVPHDSESSTGGSGSGTSLPEDAVLNPVKPSMPGEIPQSQSSEHLVTGRQTEAHLLLQA